MSAKVSKQRKILVMKLSGSVFNFKTSSKSLKEYAQVLLDIQARVQPVVVSGGGIIARHYVNLARSLGADESSLDEMGIEIPVQQRYYRTFYRDRSVNNYYNGSNNRSGNFSRYSYGNNYRGSGYRRSSYGNYRNNNEGRE